MTARWANRGLSTPMRDLRRIHGRTSSSGRHGGSGYCGMRVLRRLETPKGLSDAARPSVRSSRR